MATGVEDAIDIAGGAAVRFGLIDAVGVQASLDDEAAEAESIEAGTCEFSEP